MKTKKRADRAKTISEICGQPKGAFKKHLEEKSATLKRMNGRVESRIRESLDYKAAWAVA